MTSPASRKDLHRRPVQPRDADAIVGWFTTWEEAVTWGGPLVPNPLTPHWLAVQFTTDRYWVWHDASNMVVAVAGLKFPEAERAHLIRFGIAPTQRGQGHAQGLLAEIAEIARACGGRHLTLSVYVSNPIARRAYDRAGFAVFEDHPGKDDPGGASVRMKRVL